MPIPRHVEKEFFISNYNEFRFENNDTNQAVIYDTEYIFSSPFTFPTFTFFPRHSISRIRNISRIYELIHEPFFFLFGRRSVRSEFISEMSDIFNETINNINQTVNFQNCLNNFLERHNSCNDICTLCDDFISEIPLNNEIHNLLGNDLIIVFQKKVTDFYKKSKRKRDRKKRKSLYEQFREFKNHQSYFEKRINYQMKDKIINNKKLNLKSTHRKVRFLHLFNF